MKNLKIGIKMALGISTILLLVLLNGAFSINSLMNIDDGMASIKQSYMPLNDLAATAQGTLKDVPASMAMYLLSGQKAYWEATEKGLADASGQIDALAKAIAANPDINTDFGTQAREKFKLFAEAVRAAHDTNEAFIQNREIMIPSGFKVSTAVSDYTREMFKAFREAQARGDVAEMALSMKRLEDVAAIADGIQDIRVRMLRGMAEQNREYCRDNVSKLFPKVLADIDDLLPKVTSPKWREVVSTMREDTETFRDAQRNMLALWEQADALTARRSEARDAALAVMADVASRTSSLQSGVVGRVTQISDDSLRLISGVCVALLVLGLLIGLFLTRSITKPMNKTLGFAQAVAEGELDQRLRLDQRDEFGHLSTALNSMVDTLNEKIEEANAKSAEAQTKSEEATAAMREAEEARKAAERARSEGMLAAASQLESVTAVLSSASSQLSAQIEQSDRGAAESSQRLSEAATAMNEMNATVQEVARNASSASSASAETKQKAAAGSQIVEQAVQSIEEVHQLSLVLKDDMEQLNEHAQNITRIMNVISDIADQTNLLALNAAIEAARAGEAGRGFAVVADEVRKLAEKTMASTNDVGNAIASIQESTTKSMSAVDQAVERIGQATELANQSGQALQEIVSNVEIAADQVNAIATASEEQSAASEEINQSIVQVNDMSRQTAEAMGEAAKAVNELASQAQNLSDLIEEMKRG